MPQYQEPVIKTCLRNTKNLCAQLQASAGVGACASDLPNNAIDDSDSFASVTNPSNIESCNGSFAIFNSAPIGASGNAVLIANMCIIPDGTSAPDISIVFGSVSTLGQGSSFNIGFRQVAGGPAVGTVVWGSSDNPLSNTTQNIDLDSVNISNPNNLDLGNPLAEVVGFVATAEENNITVQVDCVSGI